MRDTKQVIVMRKDLGMRKGKMIAQGAHASLGCITKMLKDKYVSYTTIEYKFLAGNKSPIHLWLSDSFKKICVGVNSLDELMNKLHSVEYYNENRGHNIPYKLIRDSGLTEFHGNPTITCLGIGPYWSDVLDEITGDLKLL